MTEEENASLRSDATRVLMRAWYIEIEVTVFNEKAVAYLKNKRLLKPVGDDPNLLEMSERGVGFVSELVYDAFTAWDER